MGVVDSFVIIGLNVSDTIQRAMDIHHVMMGLMKQTVVSLK